MRRHSARACALLLSFALGVASSSRMERLAGLFDGDAPAPPPLGFAQLILDADCRTLRVTVDRDRELWLNGLHVGGIDDARLLEAYLSEIEDYRLRTGSYDEGMGRCRNLPPEVLVERGVEVKATRSLPYGDLALVLSAVEASGVRPVRLTLEDETVRF
jgi:hypothetical protein